MGKKKIFSKLLWIIMSIVFAILFVAMLIGTNIAYSFTSIINSFFEVKPYKLVQVGESSVDSDYFKSDYMKTDANGDPLYVEDSDGIKRPVYDDEAMLRAAKNISEKVATEGAVLLKNDNSALPLDKGSFVNLLGVSSVNWLYSGYGSGHVDAPNAQGLKSAMEDSGFTVNNTLNRFYSSSKYRRSSGQHQIDKSPMDNTCNEAPWSAYTADVKKSFEDNRGGAAIITLSRDGGEGAPWDPDLYNVVNDGLPYSKTHEDIDPRFRNNNYLQLTPQEKELIENVLALKRTGTFGKVVVVLNMANTLQMDLLSSYTDVDAILLAGMGGTCATPAVANILSGDDAPSGRLTDTFAYDNWSAPAMENFIPREFTNISEYSWITRLESGAEDDDSYLMRQEGIYVGYRYYETRYEDVVLGRGNAESAKGAFGSDAWDYEKEVAYPFGYGLSFTNFIYSDFVVRESGDKYEITLKVKNDGEKAAKEVVQIYLQKPYTPYDEANGIEKAAIELVGFAKTDVIAAGDTVSVTVTVDADRFKTYDSYGEKTYILEKGDYYLATGHNAHDALNNVLALKKEHGVTVNSDKMTAPGNKSMAWRKTIGSDDFVKYSISEATGEKITNRFDETDINLWSGSGGQKIDYLSRKDWDKTYPTSRYGLAMTDEMANKIDYTYGGVVEADPKDDMPNMGKKNGLSLISFIDVEFGHDSWDDFLDQLTFSEMANLIIRGGMGTVPIAGDQDERELNVPATTTRDGPAGLGRLFADSAGFTRAGVNYPSPCLMGSSFNLELVKDLGRVFGTELMHYGINGIYAPGAGIHRAAYSGRSWEYYSEDGFLTGEMLWAECDGLTSVGCITYAKHIGFNDQEADRNGVTVWGSEQALREIYLLGYEKACVENTTNALMSSYNRVGADWAGIHKGMLTDIVRGEWGFEGHVITDAYAYRYMETFGEGVVAGNDLWLGGQTEKSLEMHADNETVVKAMRESSHRILYTILHSNAMNGIDLNTKVVPIMTWWQITLIAVDIALGVITLGCMTMLVISFVLKRKKKPVTAKDSDSENDEIGGGK